jgi:hypothetical protein
MPWTALMVHGWDILRGDGSIYAAALERLGVPVKNLKHVFPGLPYVFQRWTDHLSS